MAQRYYNAQWDVRSLTDRTDKDGNVITYKVSRRADGGMECSCKNWIYRRKYLLLGRCKHIEYILENRNVEEDNVRMQETQAPIEVITIEEPDGRLRGLVEDLPEWKKNESCH